MKHASCVYIRRNDGKIVLTTRRKKDREATTYGLPGGKVDPGETPLQAAVRETYEETGIVLNPNDLIQVFETICEGEVDYNTTCYFINYDGEIPGGIEEEIDAVWGDVSTLLTKSPFINYNRDLMMSLGDRLQKQYSFHSQDKRHVFTCFADGIIDAETIAKSFGHTKANMMTVSVGGQLIIKGLGTGQTKILQQNLNATKMAETFTVPAKSVSDKSFFADSAQNALSKHESLVKQYRHNPNFALFWKHGDSTAWIKN